MFNSQNESMEVGHKYIPNIQVFATRTGMQEIQKIYGDCK